MQTAPLARFVPTGYFAHTQLTGDANTYATGGFPITLAMFQFVNVIQDLIAVVSAGAFVVEWVPSTSSLRVLTDPGTGLAEVSNGGSTAGLQVEMYAFGE